MGGFQYMSKKYVVDTNVLLNSIDVLREGNIVIPSIVMKEIEILERKKGDTRLQYQIRAAKRVINELLDKGLVELDAADMEEYEGTYDPNYADNIIFTYAKSKGHGLITQDILLKLKAVAAGVEVKSGLEVHSEDYTGIVEIFYDPANEADLDIFSMIQTAAHTELDMALNPLDMKTNQYLVVWDKSEPMYKDDKLVGYPMVGSYQYNGLRLVPVKRKSLKGTFFEDVEPRNVKQNLAFDLLQNKDITVKALFGIFGSGKDYLMISHALKMVEDPSSDIERVIWVRNNIEVADTEPLGFLPGELEDKLAPLLLPLKDHLTPEGLEMFLNNKLVEPQHLGTIRGRDIKNSIIYVTECQSNTKAHIQLLLGRVGEGSQIWFNGDEKQTDSAKFTHNNGVAALKHLAGNKLYGQVTFDKTERSETAQLAALLDNI